MEISQVMVIVVLRMQAWQRAKGELNAVLSSYVGQFERYQQMDDEITKFIALIEENGLQE